MAIDDLDTGTRESDMGGTDSSTSAEVDPIAVWNFWKRFSRWKRGEAKQQAAPLSWTEQREKENAQKANRATAEACNEDESTKLLREREG